MGCQVSVQKTSPSHRVRDIQASVYLLNKVKDKSISDKIYHIRKAILDINAKIEFRIKSFEQFHNEIIGVCVKMVEDKYRYEDLQAPLLEVSNHKQAKLNQIMEFDVKKLMDVFHLNKTQAKNVKKIDQLDKDNVNDFLYVIGILMNRNVTEMEVLCSMYKATTKVSLYSDIADTFNRYSLREDNVLIYGLKTLLLYRLTSSTKRNMTILREFYTLPIEAPVPNCNLGFSTNSNPYVLSNNDSCPLFSTLNMTENGICGYRFVDFLVGSTNRTLDYALQAHDSKFPVSFEKVVLDYCILNHASEMTEKSNNLEMYCKLLRLLFTCRRNTASHKLQDSLSKSHANRIYKGLNNHVLEDVLKILAHINSHEYVDINAIYNEMYDRNILLDIERAYGVNASNMTDDSIRSNFPTTSFTRLVFALMMDPIEYICYRILEEHCMKEIVERHRACILTISRFLGTLHRRECEYLDESLSNLLEEYTSLQAFKLSNSNKLADVRNRTRSESISISNSNSSSTKTSNMCMVIQDIVQILYNSGNNSNNEMGENTASKSDEIQAAVMTTEKNNGALESYNIGHYYMLACHCLTSKDRSFAIFGTFAESDVIEKRIEADTEVEITKNMKITFNQDYKKVGASYKSKAYRWVLPSIKDNRKIDESNDEVVEEINSNVENKTVKDLIADIEKLVAVTDCACIVEIEKKLNQCIAKNTNLSACIERIKQLPNEVDVIIDSTNSKDCIILEKLQAGSVEFDELLLTQYQLLHQKFVEEYENLTKYIAAVDSDIKKLQIEKQNCSRKCIHARHKIKCTKEQLMCMDDYLEFGQCGAGGNSILDNCRMLEKLKAMIQ